MPHFKTPIFLAHFFFRNWASKPFTHTIPLEVSVTQVWYLSNFYAQLNQNTKKMIPPKLLNSWTIDQRVEII